MIYIPILDKSWSPGKNLLSNQNQQVRKSFEIYIAYMFVDEVKLAIDTQKYKRKWKPLSPKYLRYKIRKGLSPHIWEATTELKKSLKVTGTNTSKITIGWDKRELHKGTKYPLYKIANHLEYGTRKMPPRPLFRYVFSYISKNISRYWKMFSKKFLNGSNPTVRYTFDKLSRRVFEEYIKSKKLSILLLLKPFKRGR